MVLIREMIMTAVKTCVHMHLISALKSIFSPEYPLFQVINSYASHTSLRYPDHIYRPVGREGNDS